MSSLKCLVYHVFTRDGRLMESGVGNVCVDILLCPYDFKLIIDSKSRFSRGALGEGLHDMAHYCVLWWGKKKR